MTPISDWYLSGPGAEMAGDHLSASAAKRFGVFDPAMTEGSRTRLIDAPDLVPNAVREALRVTSSMPIVGRSVAADITLGGKQMSAGDRVKVTLWRMDNAVGGFDIDNGPVPELRQLWFGSGKHFCLGPALSHLELEAFLCTLIAAERPWQIVRRRYRCNVFVPLYKRLDLKLV